MNSVTPSQPFCYAIKTGTNVKLHIMVKAPANKIVEFPAGPVTPPIGQTIKYKILIKDLPVGGTYQEDNFKNYIFAIAGFDTMQIETLNVVGSTPVETLVKTMKIELDDLDEVGVEGVDLPQPDPKGSSDAVLNTPYVCTKRSMDGDSFTAQIYILTDTNQFFKVTHSILPGIEKNTESIIGNLGNTNEGEDFTTEIETFGIPKVNGTNGAHTAFYNYKNKDGKDKTRKGKTKNKHHTHFPFPKPVPE